MKAGEFHHFNVEDKYFLLDVEANELYEISKKIYDLRKNPDLSQNPAYRSSMRDLRRISNNRKRLPRISSMKRELDRAEPPLTFMWFGITHDCNLRCRYCFLDIHDNVENQRYMSTRTARDGIDFLVERSGKTKDLGIIFFGGEPLLNMDLIRETVRYARGIRKKSFDFSLTTNGLLLNRERYEELKSLGISILLSLDGTKKEHDAMRVTRSGRGSWDTILRNLRTIPDFGDAIAARVTATPQNLNYSKIYDNMRRIGFKRVAITDVSSGPSENDTITERHLGRMKRSYRGFVESLFNESLQGRINTLSTFYIYADRIYRNAPVYYGCATGKNGYYLSPDRRLYPCSRMMTKDKRFCLGTLDSGIDSEKRRALLRNNVCSNECRECWARFICGGKCFADNYWENGNMMINTPFKCDLARYQIELSAYYLAKYREIADHARVA